tara:strand:- start:68030 stop:68902 length:873 start_codon:yes stop_codon:yes gene_type:complete
MAVGRKAALGLAALLVMVAWSSAWFQITATGTYVEGLDREPTISTQYSIDNDEQTFEISIENATPLILYWMQREDITEGGEPDDDPPEETSNEAKEESEDEGPERCGGDCMGRARTYLALLMVTFVATLGFSALRPSRRADAAAGISWLACLSMIVLGVPMAAAADFGIFGSDQGGETGSSTGGFDSETDGSVSIDQFAHFSSRTGNGLSSTGLVFTYESTGYDLGLLDEGDRQAVIDSAPSEGQPGHESLIGFHGELVAGPGPIFSWWFLILPLYAYSLRRGKKTDEEE